MKRIALTVISLMLALGFTLAQKSSQPKPIDTAVLTIASQPINGDPVAVDGTDLRHNEATVKPGYEFVNRGQSVDVVKVRTNKIMGTYVCPCDGTSSSNGGTCELVFSPKLLTCKGGSCSGGKCLLTAATLRMRQ